MLCVIFKVRQWANTAPAVGIARIIYRYASLLLDMAAMCARSAILISVATAPTMENARKYGERRWTCEINEL